MQVPGSSTLRCPSPIYANETVRNSALFHFLSSAYVHNAYKNPPKQNAAMTMRTKNWMIMALNDSTMTLFLNVTNANLMNV